MGKVTAIAAAPIGMRPMHQRPQPGQQIIVQMKDGAQRECHCTLIVSDSGVGIVIYPNRRKYQRRQNSIDESTAKGWWPNLEGKRR